VEDLINNDLISYNAKITSALIFIDWVEEYMNDFMKDNDTSIILGHDSRVNHLEERRNDTIQATEKLSDSISGIMFPIVQF
jgi:hypothetical protein